jgi:hypothetical protein
MWEWSSNLELETASRRCPPSCEAEYLACSHCARQILWLRSLFQEIGFPQNQPTPLYCDNQGTVICTHDPQCYVFILSWYRALTCTNVSSLFVLPACLFALTGLISDLAAISILSSYVPLCASSLTFPYLYRLSHAYVAFLL